MSKRRRTSPPPPPPPIPAPADLSITFLLPLSALAQSKLLLQACKANPSVYALALKALEDQNIEQGKEYIDFSEHSSRNWKLLNNEKGGGGWKGARKKKRKATDSTDDDDGLTNSARMDLASIIEDSLRSSFLAITSKITPFTAFETKESAISTLRKLGKSLALSDSQVATVVRSYDLPFELVLAMQEVTGKMSEEERREMVDGELEGKLRELVGMWIENELEGVEELKGVLEAFEKDGKDEEEVVGVREQVSGSGGGGRDGDGDQEFIEIVSDDE